MLRDYRYGPPAIGEPIFCDGFESGDTTAWSTTTGYTGNPAAIRTGSCFGAPEWSVEKSYAYRDGALLADYKAGDIRHYHLDHLGSVRQITSELADVVASYDYLPYGKEVDSSYTALQFAGHERDAHLAGDADDLDYMHARYFHPVTARFLSTDPKVLRKATAKPQRWNRYAYALGNPVKFVDPDGRTERKGWKAGTVRNNSRVPVWIASDIDKKVVVVPLQPGEKSTKYFADTDAVLISPGSPLDGREEGAYKIGTQDIDIEQGEGDSLVLDLDNVEFLPNLIAGKEGFLSLAEAEKEGWVIPQQGSGSEAEGDDREPDKDPGPESPRQQPEDE